MNLQFRAPQPVPTPTFAPSTFTTTTTTTTQQATPSLATSLAPSDPNKEIIRSFEEKQRLLEEQIRILVARQREHEEIIRRHQYLQEQLNNQKNEQQRQHLEEQRRRQRVEQEQHIQRQQQAQAQVSQQPQAQALIAPQSQQQLSVQFIPSVQIGHTVGISVEQQPPFKDAIEFHPENPNVQKTIQRFQFRQFQQQQQRNNAVFGQQQQQQQPLIQKVEIQQIPAASPLSTSLELPVRNAPTFNQASALPTTLELPQNQPLQQFQHQTPQNQLPALTDIIQPSQQTRPRVFRNDALQTGNFGFNNNNNNVQIQQHQVRALDNSFDNQLYNQFIQHGVNTRSSEDFRLISKILAYNHGTNQQQNNVLFPNNQG